jgi:hypothetical protein
VSGSFPTNWKLTSELLHISELLCVTACHLLLLGHDAGPGLELGQDLLSQTSVGSDRLRLDLDAHLVVLSAGLSASVLVAGAKAAALVMDDNLSLQSK